MKEVTKSPKCTNCWDKGFSTVFKGLRYAADFIGDIPYEDAPKVHKIYCSCAKGKYLKQHSNDHT